MSIQRSLWPATVVAAFLTAAVLLAPVSPGQTITRITPEAAAPGDLVIITGSFLAGAQVEFFATVGGFVGVWTVSVTPLTSSSNQLTAIVPQMAGFAPPNAVPPGNPVGTVKAISPFAPVLPNTLPFFYMQAIQSVTTEGTGSTQTLAVGKAVIGFTIVGGPPVPGNLSHILTLENALPASSAILVIGLPASPPFIPIGDGTVVVDPFGPLFFIPPLGLPPLVADVQGDVQLPLPVPVSPPTGTFMLQWVLVSNPGGQIDISNGLQVTFP